MRVHELQWHEDTMVPSSLVIQFEPKPSSPASILGCFPDVFYLVAAEVLVQEQVSFPSHCHVT